MFKELRALASAALETVFRAAGVYDFQKRSSLIEVSEAGAQMLGQIAAELAYGEGLQAHARSAEYRFKRG